MVNDGAKHHGRTNGGEIKVGLLTGDKVPGRFLGERLGEAVGRGRRRMQLVNGDGVPGLFGKGVGCVREVCLVEDGGE